MPHVNCWKCGGLNTISIAESIRLWRAGLVFACHSCMQRQSTKSGRVLRLRDFQPFKEVKTVTDYESLHKSLGCYDCKFAEKEDLGKGPCCTTNYDVDENGKCKTRKPMNKLRIQ